MSNVLEQLKENSYLNKNIKYRLLEKYSDDELADVLEAYIKGEISFRAIGKVFGCSQQATYTIIQQILKTLYRNNNLIIKKNENTK